MNQAKQILSQQKTWFFAFGTGALFIAYGIGYLMMADDHSIQTPKIHVDLPGDKVNPQDIWMNRLESENKLISQKISYLESLILESKKQEEESNKEKEHLQKELSHLKQELQFVSEKAQQKESIIAYKNPIALPVEQSYSNNYQSAPYPNSHNGNLDNLKPFNNELPSDLAFDPISPVIQEPILEPIPEAPIILIAPIQEFSMEEPTDRICHVNKVIPAGTSVKALLVSSVDAICGVFANSDPIPVKLRLLDDGHLPKGVTVKLKGAVIIASAYGNISSERVYMRLERLVQNKPNGKFIETQVAGYVTGEDGKFGVRGLVVDRSAKIVKNAAYSGFLGGISQTLQATVTKKPTDCWNHYNFSTDLVKQGCANGTANAFDMLADYYIRRAEQVQPVIQVGAGRIVDVTFTLGTEVGELHTHDKIQSIRIRSCSP
jgi:conjugal transfer pilus assembly protein TraB